MIVSTNAFFNELDLLEIKLQTLAGVVDKFVVVESTRTYSGIHKPLYFKENADRFKDFPIHHVVVDNMPMTGDAWAREGFQHNVMFRAVESLKPSIVIWNDLDELIRPEAVEQFVKSPSEPVMALDYDWLRYFVNRQNPQRWRQRVIARDGKHHVSSEPTMPMIPDAGWHFNFCTAREQLLEKINATSHYSEAQSGWYWREIYEGRHPQLDLTVAYPEEKLPAWLLANRNRFEYLFLPEGAPLA